MKLTARETQVMGVMLIWPALSNKGIAKILGVTVPAVKHHLMNFRAKMGSTYGPCTTRTELTLAIERYAVTLLPQYQLQFDFSGETYENRSGALRVSSDSAWRGV